MNGQAPRPGSVHRPTRASIPAVVGPHAPVVSSDAANTTVAIGAPSPGAYLGLPSRTPTGGRHVPATPTVLAALDAHGLTKHLVPTEGVAVVVRPDVHPRVVAVIHRVIARVQPAREDAA